MANQTNSSKPVWHSESKGSAREAFVAFAAGRDVVASPEADHALVPYDIWTNRAHALGLQKVGVYSAPQAKKILSALKRLESEWKKGEWRLDPALEDVHINIETYVTDKCGEKIGGRLHSGRSRNDQIATDMKLFIRDGVLAFCQELNELVASLLKCAKTHAATVMPGYTHHRKATLTTWGHWCASYAQGALRDAQRFQDLYRRMNTCPLGAAASYGTTWPIDRKYVAELLAFDGVQENTLDAIDSRGEAEAEFVHGIALMLKRLAAASQGLILFSTDEFGYLSLPSDFTTGSSIMPQKRNPDFAEAIKGKASVIFGYAFSLLSINASNFFGYNKDAQWTKYVFMDAVREGQGAARLLGDVIAGLKVNADKMASAAETGFLNAVDIADALARTRDLPFRSTYKIMSDAVGQSKSGRFKLDGLNQLLNEAGVKPLSMDEFHNLTEPQECIAQRDHDGSPHPQQLKKHLTALAHQNSSLAKWTDTEQEKLNAAQKRCLRGDLA
ncbi:MAG: argininosuccinate lyase [Candidatus Hinthialibacter antarcticus]|nr:argininosuccinate lyase [Candidatus Hinthialibacter antarcticus]